MCCWVLEDSWGWRRGWGVWDFILYLVPNKEVTVDLPSMTEEDKDCLPIYSHARLN